MPPCREAGCTALATANDRCSVHAQGLHRHHVRAEDENTLRCARCRRMVRDGEWFRDANGVIEHATECLPKE